LLRYDHYTIAERRGIPLSGMACGCTPERSKRAALMSGASYSRVPANISRGNLTLGTAAPPRKKRRTETGPESAARQQDSYPPLGYDVRERKLEVNESEARQVRAIFERYLKLGSVWRGCDARGNQELPETTYSLTISSFRGTFRLCVSLFGGMIARPGSSRNAVSSRTNSSSHGAPAGRLTYPLRRQPPGHGAQSTAPAFGARMLSSSARSRSVKKGNNSSSSLFVGIVDGRDGAFDHLRQTQQEPLGENMLLALVNFAPR
jgi:hypothetical protein